MSTTRLILLARSLAVLSLIALFAGCWSSGAGSGHKPAPESLSVIITSPTSNVTISQGQSVDFQAKVSGGTSPYTYLWDFDGGANDKTVENTGMVPFEAAGNYTVKLTATDAKGVAASASVVITVNDRASDTPPGVSYTSPSDGATNIATSTQIQVAFTGAVDISTVTASTFMVSNGSIAIAGTVTSSGSSAVFTPASPLLYGTVYTAKVTTGVKGLTGNPFLTADYTWSFSTVGYTLDASITSPSGNVTIAEGTSVNFQGSATGGTAPYSYKWNFMIGMQPSTEQNPGDVIFNTRGSYMVVLRVTDANGYLSTAVMTVTVYSTTAGDWVSLSAGGGHTLALKSDGTLWSWGDNTYGQLGNGSHVNRVLPVQVGTENTWASMSAGDFHSLAIKKDGTLWSWGLNSKGQLGDGTLVDKTAPVQVGSEDTWTAVLAGSDHSLALRNDGTLWAWGFNKDGQLGDGTWDDKDTPVQIGTEGNWAAAAAGNDHNLAIKKDGTLWSWGLNDHGQLGDGTSIDSNMPLQVSSDNTWVKVAAGNGHSLALKKDGTLIAWGKNNHGQLGDGTNTDRYTPVQVGLGISFVWDSMAAGYDHSIALRKDGTMWAWGYNTYGQLGDGTVVNKDTPVQVGSDSTWSALAAGYYHTGAITSGGTLWMWGYNASGQLGNGTLSNSPTPIQVKW